MAWNESGSSCQSPVQAIPFQSHLWGTLDSRTSNSSPSPSDRLDKQRPSYAHRRPNGRRDVTKEGEEVITGLFREIQIRIVVDVIQLE